MAVAPTLITDHGTSADFDFFIGAWRVHHQRLKDRLVGCQQWEHFEGCTRVQKMLDGHANVDDNLLHLPSGDYRALTLRSFDAATGQWTIWWLDGRYPGRIDVPVVGSFSKGIGCFYANDMLNGQAICVRFVWTPCSELGLPRWEQAFSGDGGQTWETNWVMDFQRQNADASASPCA
jgi:hypothetical protein